MASWNDVVSRKITEEFLNYGIYQGDPNAVFLSMTEKYKTAKAPNADMANVFYSIFFTPPKSGNIADAGFDLNWQGMDKGKIDAAWKTENGKLLKNFGNKAVLSKLGPKAPAPMDLFDDFVKLVAGRLDVLTDFDVSKKALAQKRVAAMGDVEKKGCLKMFEPYRVQFEKVGLPIKKLG